MPLALMLAGQLMVGTKLSVKINTSSVETAHGGLVIVQRRLYVTPAVKLNVEVGLDGFTMVPPVPDTMLQDPVPTLGALAARVVVVAQSIWLGPALAIVEGAVKVITTSSAVSVQGGFATVQRRVYVLPDTPENPEEALPGVVIDPPVPVTIVQVPAPDEGVFPAKLVVDPQTI